MNAANAYQQGVTGAGACPSLRALGDNAHSPLTPTPSAAPGTRTRGVAISRPQCFSCPLTWNLPHPWPATAVGWFQPVGGAGHRQSKTHARYTKSSHRDTARLLFSAGIGSLFSSLYSVSTQPIPLGVIVTVSKFWDIPVPSARGEACTPLPARRAKIQSWIGISSSPLPAWVSRQLPCG